MMMMMIREVMFARSYS